jgi:hypothetical protein
MHRRDCPRDFAAHAQQPAKPKFVPAGRRESGKYSDQERRTSQPAGEALELPCRRWLEYTGKSSRNASPCLYGLARGFTGRNTLAGNGGSHAGHHQGGSRILQRRGTLGRQP